MMKRRHTQTERERERERERETIFDSKMLAIENLISFLRKLASE